MKKWMILLLALLLMPVMALADGPVLLVELGEEAQMVENVEFEDGEFIQTYQLGNGVTVQLLRYMDFEMSMDELIASDWPDNCGVKMEEMTEISGYPASHAHIWQTLDESGYPVKAQEDESPEQEQQMMEIDLVMVTVGNATLIYQDSYMAGQRGDATVPIIDSLQVHTGEEVLDETVEVG